MIEFTIQIEIARPVDEVFAYVADPARSPSWQTNTISVSQEGDGPLVVGTRLQEVHRAPGGKQLVSLVEVVELEPPRIFALETIEGLLPMHARMSFEPSNAGTRMSFIVHGQPSGAMRLVQPLLRLSLKGQFVKHRHTLKRVLEHPPV